MSTEDPAPSPDRIARALIRKRDYRRAIKVLQKVLDESPTDTETMELLGTVLFFNKQPQDALDMFEQLTITEPFRASGWINMGAVLNHLGEYKKAADALRKGLQRDRHNAEAYYNMGIAQKALKLTTMAISAYKEALRIKPDMVEAHVSLGQLYSEMNNNGLAQQCYQSALKIDPSSKKARMLLEKTLGTQREARKSASPFGRLVDAEGLAANLRSTAKRALNDVQRVEERELVQTITKRIRHEARDLVPLLDDDLQELLHQLQIVSVQEDNRFANPDTHERLISTIETMRELRMTVADGFAELRSHLKL